MAQHYFQDSITLHCTFRQHLWPKIENQCACEDMECNSRGQQNGADSQLHVKKGIV